MASPTRAPSPLDPVFAGHTHIPFALSEQFLHNEECPYGMRLDGVMTRIWYRPASLGPLFWLLGKLGILVPRKAVDVPTTLVVRPGQNSNDGLYHIWDRTFAMAKPVRFRTTILSDPELGKYDGRFRTTRTEKGAESSSQDAASPASPRLAP
jgi:hypothetical protein